MGFALLTELHLRSRARVMKKPKPADPQSALCEVCLNPVPKAEALMSEGRDHVAYFCGSDCYDIWRGERASRPPSDEVQEGLGRSISRDERMKRLTRQHPQRDAPRLDSVEADDIPPS